MHITREDVCIGWFLTSVSRIHRSCTRELKPVQNLWIRLVVSRLKVQVSLVKLTLPWSENDWSPWSPQVGGGGVYHVWEVDPNLCEGFLGAFMARAGIFKKSMGARHRGGIGLSYRPARAGIFKKSMGAKHRGGIGFSYRPARLHRLAEFIPWHQFRGPINI
jgi:hypothetical protein